MSTTANLSVGIDTSPAREGLRNFKTFLTAELPKQQITLGIDGLKAQTDIQGWLDRKRFRVTLAKSEFVKDLNDVLDNAFGAARSRTKFKLTVDQKDLTEQVEKAVERAFLSKSYRVGIDLPEIVSSIRQSITAAASGTDHRVRIDSMMLTFDVANAVKAGMAGVKFPAGGAAGLAQAVAKTTSVTTPVTASPIVPVNPVVVKKEPGLDPGKLRDEARLLREKENEKIDRYNSLKNQGLALLRKDGRLPYEGTDARDKYEKVIKEKDQAFDELNRSYARVRFLENQATNIEKLKPLKSTGTENPTTPAAVPAQAGLPPGSVFPSYSTKLPYTVAPPAALPATTEAANKSASLSPQFTELIKSALAPAVAEIVSAADALKDAAKIMAGNLRKAGGAVPPPTSGTGAPLAEAEAPSKARAKSGYSNKNKMTGETISYSIPVGADQGLTSILDSSRKDRLKSVNDALLNQKLKEIALDELQKNATREAIINQKLKEIGKDEKSKEREELLNQRKLLATNNALVNQKLKEIGKDEKSKEREELLNQKKLNATNTALVNQKLKEIGKDEKSKEREELLNQRKLLATNNALVNQKLKEIGKDEKSKEREELLNQKKLNATNTALVNQKLKEIGKDEKSKEREELLNQKKLLATNNALVNQKLKEIGKDEKSKEREDLLNQKKLNATNTALVNQKLKEIGKDEKAKEKQSLETEKSRLETQSSLLKQRLAEIALTEKLVANGRKLNETGQRAQQVQDKRVDTRVLVKDTKLQAARDGYNATGQAIKAFDAVSQKYGPKVARAVFGSEWLGNELRNLDSFKVKAKVTADAAAVSMKQAIQNTYNSSKFAAEGKYTARGQKIAGAVGVLEKHGETDPVRQVLNNQGLLDQAKAVMAGTASLKEHEKAQKAVTSASSGAALAVNDARQSHRDHTQAMYEARSAARGLASSLGALWATYGSIVPLLAFAAIGSALRSVYEEGKKVEYQLAFVKGLAGQAVSQKEVESTVAGSMSNPIEALAGLRALAQSGLSAKEALAALPEVLNLATVGEISVGEAAYAATGVMKAFALSVDDIGRVSDVMAKSAAISNASVQDMMASFKYASASASMYGSTLEETGASLAMLSEKNIKGSMAGTAHMNLLREIYTPTKKAATAFKALGLDMEDMQRQGLSSVEMIDKIRQATSRLDSAAVRRFAAEIGGERGMRELAPLIESGTKKLVDMRDELLKSKGFTTSVMLELQNTVEGSTARMKQAFTFALSGAFDESKGSIQTFQNTIAAAIGGPEVKETIESLARGMVTLTRFLIDNAEAIRNLVLVYAGLKALGVIAALMGSLASSFSRVALAAQQKAVALQAAVVAGVEEGVAARAQTLAQMRQNIALAEGIVLQRVNTTATLAGAAASVTAATATTAAATAQLGSVGVLARVAGATGSLAAGFTGAAGAAGLFGRALGFLTGPIGGTIILLGSLWPLFEMLAGSQDHAREAQDRFKNSVDNSNRILDQEIARLERKKWLLDNPGKTEERATLDMTVEKRQQRITAISNAYEYDISPDGGHRGQKFNIPNMEGKFDVVKSGAELKKLFNTLPAERQALAELVRGLEKVAQDSANIDRKSAQVSLVKWIDDKLSLLEARKEEIKNDKDKAKVKAKLTEIDDAVAVLKIYKGTDALKFVNSTTQVDAIKKQLQTRVVDPSGDKMPRVDKAAAAAARAESTAISNAEMTALDRILENKKQEFKDAQQIDTALYGTAKFGPYMSAMAAQIRIERELVELEEDRVFAITEFAKVAARPEMTSADKENIATRGAGLVLKYNREIQQLDQQLKLARINSQTTAVTEKKSDTFESSKLLSDSQAQITGIYKKYNVKALSSADASELEARLAQENIFRDAIRKKADDLNFSQERLLDLQTQASDKTGEAKVEADKLVATARARVAEEQKVLQGLRDQAEIQTDIAGKVARDEQIKSETPEAGFNKFWKDYQEQGTNAAQRVEQTMKTATQGMTDALTQFVMTGKLSFKSLISSMLQDLVRIQMNKMLTNVIGSFNLFGGTGASPTGGSGISLGGVSAGSSPSMYSLSSGPVLMANGGIVSEFGSLPLQKYARGGVANSPQLALFGEGRKPEAYVPLPDGRTIPVTMASSAGKPSINMSYSPTISIDSRSDRAQIMQMVSQATQEGQKQMLEHLHSIGVM